MQEEEENGVRRKKWKKAKLRKDTKCGKKLEDKKYALGLIERKVDY